MEQAGDQRQVWLTELGWSTQAALGGPPPVSPEQQAENLVGALRLTSREYRWVTAVFVWNLNFAIITPPEDEKSGFGILNGDWSPRPAYLALQTYLNRQAQEREQLGPRFSPDAPYRAGWELTVEGKARTTPVLGRGGTIYVASDPGLLYAIAPAGGLRWVFRAPGATRDAPATGSDGTLYLGDESGALTALSPAGRVLWQLVLTGGIRGTPQLDRDRLYVATQNGELLSLSLAGEVIWRSSLGSPAAPPMSHDGTVYLGTQAGDVVALSSDGSIRWRTSVGQPIAAAPALAQLPDGSARLLIGDAAGFLSCFDAVSGVELWRTHIVARVESPTLTRDSPLITAPPLVTLGEMV